MDFMKLLQKNEVSYSDNGAAMYKTSGHKLLDLNFNIISLRNRSIAHDDIWQEYAIVLKENPIYALKWLLFLRDIRGGVGEREVFRNLFHNALLYYTQLDISKLINYVAEYGRWDDIVDIFFRVKEDDRNNFVNDKEDIANLLLDAILNQLKADEEALANKEYRKISLLAKWLPSRKTSSIKSRKRAIFFIHTLKISEKSYRKKLVALRKGLNIVEQLMCDNKWQDINYSVVPSRANLSYHSAFFKHDPQGYKTYLDNVKANKAKINVQALYPHEIVHKYYDSVRYSDSPLLKYNESIELMWKSLSKPTNFKDTLVVRDGSASMLSFIRNNKCSMLEVADALTLYCAENNKSEHFKNKFITFSSLPQIINVSATCTLQDKLNILDQYHDYSNTNIEAVFDLILNAAQKNHVSQESLPKNILIISDMQFDYASTTTVNSTLFETINEKFSKAKYKMPKLIFWNLCGHTSAIPMQENENGVILLSGFSISLLEMVCSSEIDPLKCLYKVLDKERYSIIDKLYPSSNTLNEKIA